MKLTINDSYDVDVELSLNDPDEMAQAEYLIAEMQAGGGWFDTGGCPLWLVDEAGHLHRVALGGNLYLWIARWTDEHTARVTENGNAMNELASWPWDELGIWESVEEWLDIWERFR